MDNMRHPPANAFDICGSLVAIRMPGAADCREFMTLAQASREFLRPWIDPPATDEQFDAYLKRLDSPADCPLLVCERRSGRIAGAINISCIVRGHFQSAFLGFWIGQPFARRGYMSEALPLVVRYAFDDLKLHRLEANIQPENAPSLALVRKCGFAKEGFSPKYLKVFGEWRDHERWAIVESQRSKVQSQK
jgi:ribosomal-protein-alanine N-acetyltransferase